MRAAVPIPLIAAGGLTEPGHVRAVLGAGAAAAMVGTALLRTDESGASETHRAALTDPARDRTVITRAFTGRPARGLRNAFTDRYDDVAPSGYPALHHLTSPLRKAAAADPGPDQPLGGHGPPAHDHRPRRRRPHPPGRRPMTWRSRSCGASGTTPSGAAKNRWSVTSATGLCAMSR